MILPTIARCMQSTAFFNLIKSLILISQPAADSLKKITSRNRLGPDNNNYTLDFYFLLSFI